MGWFTCGTTDNLKIRIGQSPKKDVTARHPHPPGTEADCNRHTRIYIQNIRLLSAQIHVPKTQQKLMMLRSWKA